LVNHLPCKRCGGTLSLVEGSLAQCFFCGVKTEYSEALNLLNTYLTEILSINSIDNISENLTKEELERRKKAIHSLFHDLNSRYYEYKYLIITRIDDVEIEKEKLLDLIRDTGILKIIVEEAILPFLDEGVSKDEFLNIRNTCYIFNKSLLGLYFSYLAKNQYELNDCSTSYQYVERNFQNIVQFCDEVNIEILADNFTDIKILFSVLEEFSVLLRDILTENPNYSSEKFENLVLKLNQIQKKDYKILNLQAQIERIYSLGRDTSLLLEEIRISEILKIIDPFQENILFNTEEIIENADRIRSWFTEISERYQNYQKQLLKLHLGKFPAYLETYRQEFTNRKTKGMEKFDELLESTIEKALGDYNIETMETLDILSDYVKKFNLSIKILINKFENEHEDLIKLDETLKKFVFDLAKKAYFKDLESEFSTQLITLISEKHSDFDQYILKFINKIIREFEDYRNEKALSLQEQREKFKSELNPQIQRLLDASFTLNEELIPYPLFIEVIMITKILTVGIPEKITVLLENPSKNEIKNINISFFVPNSFQSRLRFAQIKKLKGNEKREIKTEIVPTEKGIYHFMVMVEYQTVGEIFWMPSIKFELEVNEEL